jgi:DNA-binding Lrp family transcriptional regulator
MQHAAGREAHLAQSPRELLVAGHHSGHDVPVSAQVLGGAVQDQAGPLSGGALQHGCGEGVVGEQRDGAAGVRDGAQVEFGERRVGRGLDHDKPGVRAQGVRDARRVDPGHLGAQQSGGQQVIAAAVQGPYGDDMAQAERAAHEQYGAQRGHAAREGDRALGAFEAGEGGLETGDGRVAEAAVDGRALRFGAVGRERVDAGGLAAAVVRGVGRGQVDRRGVQPQPGEVLPPGVHGLGGEGSGAGRRDTGVLNVVGVVLSVVCVVHHGFHAQQTEHRTGPRPRTPCYVRAMAESVVLDPVDLHLLRLLQNDARTTYRDLAAQVGVAPSTCLDRVTRLRRAGVILGHQLRLDPAKLGRGLEALLSVQVRPHRRELVGPFVDRIRALPESRTVFHLTGPDDYLVLVAVADMADLQRLVLDEFTSRREVARVETRLIFQQWDCGPLLPPAPPSASPSAKSS